MTYAPMPLIVRVLPQLQDDFGQFLSGFGPRPDGRDPNLCPERGGSLSLDYQGSFREGARNWTIKGVGLMATAKPKEIRAAHSDAILADVAGRTMDDAQRMPKLHSINEKGQVNTRIPRTLQKTS